MRWKEAEDRRRGERQRWMGTARPRARTWKLRERVSREEGAETRKGSDQQKEGEDRRRGERQRWMGTARPRARTWKLRERVSREEGAETRKGSDQQKEGQGTVGWRF